MDPDEDDREPTTRKLKLEQTQREREAEQGLAESVKPEEARQHQRRGDKAAYLREKLAERERAEREAEDRG